jgi:2-methylcitrate dehydratase PrpD
MQAISAPESGKPGPTAQFGAWASNLGYDAIPAEVIEHAKLCLLDGLGCGLFGSTQKWGAIMSELAVELSGGGASSLWGRGAHASPSDAALVNGTAIHGYEIDDVHQRGLFHPGAVTLPAVIALAEARNKSGRSLLAAIVAGYEVGARVSTCAGIPHQLKGYHPTGTAGCLGAAAGAANLLGLSAEETTHALAIAATQAAGLYSAVQAGAMAKRMHAGRAAQSGVLAALLAQKGFTGSPDVLETPVSGYMSTLADHADLAPYVATLGREWETATVGFKAYAACASAHTTIDAVRALIKRGLTPAKLEHLTVRASRIGMNNVGWEYKATSITGAQMNGSFAAAVQLTDGDAFIEQYREDRIADPVIMGLIQKIEFKHDPDLDKGGAATRHAVKVEAVTRSGEVLHEYVEQRRGSTAHPLPVAEVEAKFRKTAGAVLAPDAVEQLREWIWSADLHNDVRGLSDLLAGSARSAVNRFSSPTSEESVA